MQEKVREWKRRRVRVRSTSRREDIRRREEGAKESRRGEEC